MVLKLDTRYPLVWRTPFSVQLGIDPPAVVLDEVTDAQERMLAALAVGVSSSGLDMLARGVEPERDALLAALDPVLETARAATGMPLVAITGEGALAESIADALAGHGLGVRFAAVVGELTAEHPDLAVATGHFVLDPGLHGHWLRRDVPHLPVVLSDTAVLLGPVVEPGSGACLRCIELHRRDADPAWPAIAAQLLGRRSRAELPALVADATALACRLVLTRLADGTAVPTATRIAAADGARGTLDRPRHPECGCGGEALLSPPRPGTGWADAHRRGRPRTSFAPVGAAPA